jgi:hypothetical protein
MKSYYYVGRVGGGHPKIKHPHLEVAHAEAMRLASQHPGEKFEILQCIGITQTTNPETVWAEEVIPKHHCELHRIMSGPCLVCGKSLAVNEPKL